jgi:hypothetical protein
MQVQAVIKKNDKDISQFQPPPCELPWIKTVDQNLANLHHQVNREKKILLFFSQNNSSPYPSLAIPSSSARMPTSICVCVTFFLSLPLLSGKDRRKKYMFCC